jgi:ubiquinone/menaquinone biosynthesis C-methylase UbiE
MTEYLNHPGFDWDSPQMAADYDQNSNWSPYFGELIFQHLPLRENQSVLDVACGTGYPTLELSQRLGPTSQVYGIDTWQAALDRAQHKVDGFDITNVTLQNEDAEAMSFPDSMFDVIVSNVGINNFESPTAVLRECFRVAKPGALVAMTTNPVGHMAEFYRFYKEALRALKLEQHLDALEKHIAHRYPSEWVCEELESAGFVIRRVLRDSFSWRFLDGTSFLNTFHIMYGFLGGWKEVIPEKSHVQVFSDIEKRINEYAKEAGEFKVTVPIRYIEAEKPTH